MAIDRALAFRIESPLGFTVRCTNTYWNFIVSHKHPIMLGREAEIRIVLADPDEIRRSRKDSNVLLFYRGDSPRWMCAVVRRENGEGFLITAYPTDTVKAGEQIWRR